MASVHSHFELDREAQTRRLLTAIQDPSVRMLGHLTARMIGGRPPIELDLSRIFQAARANNVAVEVNGALPRLDPSTGILREALNHDVKFLLTSDAHSVDELGLIDFAARHAFKARLPLESVVNAWPGDRLAAFVSQA